MKKCILSLMAVLALLLSACGSRPRPTSEPLPSLTPAESLSPTPSPSPSPTPEPSEEDYPELLYNTTATFDPETNIQRTTLDPQGLDLIVYFEIPVFQEEGKGYQKINAFFENLRDDFLTPENESLTYAWMNANDGWLMRYCCDTIVYTQGKTLISVNISGCWTSAALNTWSDSYTFAPQTGELLTLSELIQESEEDALEILWTAMENSEIVDMDDVVIKDLKQRTLDEFEFYVADDTVYIAFDRYEAAPGAAGSFDLPLPVTLKSEYCAEIK